MPCRPCGKMRLAARFTKEISQITKNSVMKGSFVDKEKSRKRLQICRSCVYIKEQKNICRLCGCYVNIKALFTQAACPKGYWEKPPRQRDNGTVK